MTQASTPEATPGEGLELSAWDEMTERVRVRELRVCVVGDALVAGIGDPERFFAMLRDAGIAVVPHAFPDHHAYAAPDFDFGSRLPVLMTAKDAVKCAGLVDAQAFMVPVEAVLPEPFWLALLDRLPARSR